MLADICGIIKLRHMMHVSASMHHQCNILLQITAHRTTTAAYITKQHGNCRSRVEALSVIYIYEYYSYICIRLMHMHARTASHHLYDLYMIYMMYIYLATRRHVIAIIAWSYLLIIE